MSALPDTLGPIKRSEKREIGIIENALITGDFTFASKYIHFVIAILAAFSWVGGVLGAVSVFRAEKGEGKNNEFLKLWLEDHRKKIQELQDTISEIIKKFDTLGDAINERIQSPEYLVLVKEAFKAWDNAATKEKKEMIKRLVTNAVTITLSPDDFVRIFIKWIDQYHEFHFAVMVQIYKDPGITRGEIWDNLRQDRPRDDSPEADMYKLLIRDLSLGGVIRQETEIDSRGRLLKKKAQKSTNPSRVKDSAFEESSPYVLTELGKRFLHYVMEDVVPQIDGQKI